MTFNFVEICRVDDKYASYYLNANKEQGLDIFDFKGKYFTIVTTDSVWRCSTAQFKSVESGTYVLKSNEFVKVS